MYKPFEITKDGNTLWLVRHSETKALYQFNHYNSAKGCLYQKPAEFNKESEAKMLCNLLNAREVVSNGSR